MSGSQAESEFLGRSNGRLVGQTNINNSEQSDSFIVKFG